MRYDIRFVFLLLIGIITLNSKAFSEATQIYPNGNAVITVPANQYVNVFTQGQGNARVFQQVGGPANNNAPKFAEMTGSPVTNGEGAFGPFTNATTVRIESQADFVQYTISGAGVATTCLVPYGAYARTQWPPVTQTTTATALSTDIINGMVIYTSTAGSTVDYTLPTGTLLDAASGLTINQGFEWSLINLSSSSTNTITLIASSGHTIVGDAITQASAQATGGNASRWFTRKTAVNTFITYRIN
jgi:hypothetical protein